jgi:hypothetical protein
LHRPSSKNVGVASTANEIVYAGTVVYDLKHKISNLKHQIGAWNFYGICKAGNFQKVSPLSL